MIEVNTIRFRPSDVPELPELEPVRKAVEKAPTPEPEDWRPLGAEW